MASKKVMDSAKCPECHHESPWEVWSVIDVGTDPALRDDVLDGTLFAWQCKNCGKSIGVLNDLVYKDPINQFAIALERENDDEQEAKDRFLGDDASLYENCRLVSSFFGLIEKIICFENGFDDRAMELFKLLLLSSEEGNEFDSLVMEGVNEDGILMRAWKANQPVGLFVAPPDLYIQMDTKVRTIEQEKDQFLRIDQSWAVDFFQKQLTAEKGTEA